MDAWSAQYAGSVLEAPADTLSALLRATARECTSLATNFRWRHRLQLPGQTFERATILILCDIGLGRVGIDLYFPDLEISMKHLNANFFPQYIGNYANVFKDDNVQRVLWRLARPSAREVALQNTFEVLWTCGDHTPCPV